MSKEPLFRTGIVSCDGKDFVFYLRDFQFCIIDPSKESIGIFPNGTHPRLSANADGLICGTTHQNKDIAIYAPDVNDKSIDGVCVLNTDHYWLRTSNLLPTPRETDFVFDTIVFTGGTLLQTFSPNKLSIEFENKEILTKQQDDSISFEFQYNDSPCTVTISSKIIMGNSVGGVSISNTQVNLVMHFDKQQKVGDAFIHYKNICKLLSFMTFRQNVFFEKVSVWQTNEDKSQQTASQWDLYTKSTPYEPSKKSSLLCISFSDIKDYLQPLLKIIYCNIERKPHYLANFIPSDDASYGRIDDNTIKSICSSLECEIALSDMPENPEAKQLKELVDKVKEVVKAHQHGKNPLSPKSYAKIDGNIKHWGMATADQVEYLYNKHMNAVESIPAVVKLGKDDISNFIKYRNDITHGSYRVGDKRIAQTAFALEGLVYCCILSRVGIPEEEIEKLCAQKVLR